MRYFLIKSPPTLGEGAYKLLFKIEIDLLLGVPYDLLQLWAEELHLVGILGDLQ